MIDVLYYGSGQDSQRVIDVLDGVIEAEYGYRFEPASRRDDGKAVWGVRIEGEPVDEAAVTEALENEFGSLNPVQS